MIIREKILSCPRWSKRDVNRWADFIEMRCLYHQDHLVSKDDMLDLLEENDISELYSEEELTDLRRGSEDHSEKIDQLNNFINNYYEIIKYRSKIYGDYYPFEIENRCISQKMDDSKIKMHYIFLLLCSHVSFMDKSAVTKITKQFEAYCEPIMRVLSPVDARTELFGTARGNGVFRGNLGKRISALATLLGAQTTKTMDADASYDRIPGGDGGLDIVSVVKIDDASHLPFAFGQCTCSYDEWINKQHSIAREKWIQRIEPLPEFIQYMYVPFSCHDASGKFEEATSICTCLIDRQRILKIVKTHTDIVWQVPESTVVSCLSDA